MYKNTKTICQEHGQHVDQSCHKNENSKLQPSGTYIQTVVSINVPGIHLT